MGSRRKRPPLTAAVRGSRVVQPRLYILVSCSAAPSGRRLPRAVSVVRVSTVDPLADARWDAFVSTRPDAVVYHHSAWLAALEREYGTRPVGLACEDAHARFVGVLPLLRTRGLPLLDAALLGTRLASLPRTPVAGPLAVDRPATAALVGGAVDLARGEPGSCLQIKASSGDLNEAPAGLTRVAWRPSYAVALPNDVKEIRFGNARNHGAVRRAVNKAAKAGVRVRVAETEAQLRAWYGLYLETMRWHAIPPRPFRFFVALWELLRPKGLMRLLVAELDGSPPRMLAGSILLMFGGTVFYAFNGRRREDLSLRPNDAIHWRAIHDACSEGFRRYDFGEVPVGNEGLAQFKRKWATETATLYRYYYPPPRADQNGRRVPAQAAQLGKAIWRRTPLAATALVGDALWRYG